MNILVINGPNINMLGRREKDQYGSGTYKELCRMITDKCTKMGYGVELFQSNSEGEIITKIQESLDGFDAIIINPAAYTHTSVGILDALKMFEGKIIEVHISDVDSREEFRRISYISYAADERITGMGFEGYLKAVDLL